MEAPDTTAWRKFAVDVLGLPEGPGGADGSAAASRRRAAVPDPHREGPRESLERRLGFRDDAALEAAIDRLRKRASRSDRAVDGPCSVACGGSRHCADPTGNRLELYVGRAYDYAPFASSRGLSGFVTGDMGIGHVVRCPAPELKRAGLFKAAPRLWRHRRECGLRWARSRRTLSSRHLFPARGQPAPPQPRADGRTSPSGCVCIMLEARTLRRRRFCAGSLHGSGRAHLVVVRQALERLHAFVLRADPGRIRSRGFGCGGLQPDWKTWVPTHSLIPDLWGASLVAATGDELSVDARQGAQCTRGRRRLRDGMTIGIGGWGPRRKPMAARCARSCARRSRT